MFNKTLLIGFMYGYALLYYAESSYSGVTYRNEMRRMASIKSSRILRDVFAPSQVLHLQVSSRSRVRHVTDYGADPTGRSDSTESIQQAISDAFHSPADSHLMVGVADLGGAEVHLDGGTYKISRPLRLPLVGGGNFMIHGGSLRASDNFPGDRHLIELWASSDSDSMIFYEDITIKDVMLDSNFRGGGILVHNSLRTSIDNCYISRFSTDGILIRQGHESYVRNCFIGQHINVGGDHREKDFSGVGIKIMGNDNAVTDVVIFSAEIGVLILGGQANVLTGVHCYNKATRWGGAGIYIRAPGLTQTRIINCYLDFTGIVAEDPVQLHITGSFFLGNAYIMLKSLKGIVQGVNIVDNMFSGDWTGVRIVQLDQLNGYFTNIEQVVVDRNNVRGMVLKSTVARGSVRRNATIWTADFSRVLLFPNLIKNVHYTLHVTSNLFPKHVLRNVSENRVTVETDMAVSGTLHVSVDQTYQSMVEYIK